MKRLVLVVLVAVAVAGGVYAMAEVTQNRPDVVRARSVTTIELTVSTRDFQRGEPAAAAALWAVCAAMVDGDVSPAEHIGAAWQVTIRPAIGEHGEKRLVGCLEDVTLDRVVGHVVAVRS